ncbi:MAG: thioredoxin [Candidatus Omnitrophota bacterium]|jgi:thioredoxin 1|nr:MAG: thioredoxin [Candidatus Omnitrophota bacterium]
MSIVHLTSHNFKEKVLDSDVPVLVDFWAPWCGPCKIVAPIIEELAKEFHPRIRIGKLDIDESPQAANRYGIMSIPTLVFFKEGKIIEQIAGALTKADLRKKIEAHI